MNASTVTVTTKNQITLPADYVRQLGLTKNRKLAVVLKDGKLELTPQPSLNTIMQKHWSYAAKRMKRPLTDEELNNAARDAYANKKQ